MNLVLCNKLSFFEFFFAILRASNDLSIPGHIREASSHLILRITVHHELPIENDMLDDARLVVNYFVDKD